ncbi:hypothetical protein, partial [Francisella philomiragia]
TVRIDPAIATTAGIAKMVTSGVMVWFACSSFLDNLDKLSDIKDKKDGSSVSLEVAITISNLMKSFIEIQTTAIEALNDLNEKFLNLSNSKSKYVNYQVKQSGS